MCATRPIVFYCLLLATGILLLAGIALIVTQRQHVLNASEESDSHKPPPPNGAADNTPPHLDVRIEPGRIRGRLARTHFNGWPFYAFEGVPYARPPLGPEGRFRAPRPLTPGPDAWPADEVRECFAQGPLCLQGDEFDTQHILGSEDCLHLNVYTPAAAAVNATAATRLPVIVYLFGGAFYRRSPNSTQTGADFLIEQSVVLVSLQFRLGVLGLLAIDGEDGATSAGNWHFKDQQLALRWVQRNIAAFGGDPNRVTLFGHSSGSLAVQLHLQAPASRGLFHRAIEMSLSFDGRAMFRPRSETLIADLEQLVADEMRIDVRQNVTAMMEALRRIEAPALLRRFPFVQFRMPIMPTIESPLASDAFVAGESPAKFALEEPFDIDMPLLTGCTSNEAISAVASARLAAFRRQPTVDIPSVHFVAERDGDSDAYRRAEARVFTRYFGRPEGAADATLEQATRLYSDVFQSYPLDRKVRALARWNRSPTWAYQFDLDTAMNKIKRGTPELLALPGAGHSDDLCYLFYCGAAYPGMYAEAEADSKSTERRLIEQMSGLYGRFAWGLEPEWEPVRRDWRQRNGTAYMHMGMDGWSQRRNAMGEGRQFWDDIVSDFGYGEL